MRFLRLLPLLCLLTFNVAGQSHFEKCLLLDGNRQYFEIPDTTFLNPSNERDLTIEFMFRFSDDSTSNILNKWRNEEGLLFDARKSVNRMEGHSLLVSYLDLRDGFETPDVLRQIVATSTVVDQSISNLALATDTWYYWAIVFEKDGRVLRYRNGQLLGWTFSSNWNLNTEGPPMTFGGFEWVVDSLLDANSYLNGCIDEIRFWNRPRSESELVATMNDTLGPAYFTGNSNLVAYYRFDDIEDHGVYGDGANDIRDLTANGHHGQLVGGPGLMPHQTVGIDCDYQRANLLNC